MAEMSYTFDPFTRDSYWVIASDDLNEFMAASIDDNPFPHVVFFEVEDKAREVSLMEETPVKIRGCVMRFDKDECLEVAEMLRENGFASAIALENGSLMCLTPIPGGSEEEM